MGNENSSPSTDKLGLPRFAAANVDKVNVADVEQLVSEVPTGTKVSTVGAQFKPTLKSNRRILNRGTVFGRYHLNTPLKDGELYVNSCYPIIKTMAANYQRTHQDGFFEAWPGCLLLENGAPIPETNEIRAKFEEYSEALAHYAYHYYQGKCMLTGALANLLVLSRLNGNAALKDIAADVRWSRVNTYTNLYSRFPDPIGLEDFIMSNTAYAIGKTSYGADILCFPEWVVDVYGNRGSFALTPDEVITNYGGLGAAQASANLNNPSQDGLYANKLLENIVGSLVEYSCDPSDVDGNIYHPRMPRVENGSVLWLQDSSGELAVSLNMANLNEYHSSPDPFVTHNQITATAWKNYLYWQDYMIRNFPEMLDPNSDIYVFFTTQLKLFTPSKKVKELLDIVHSLKNVDMVDLRESMKYKNHNAVTTSTILKWMPLCGGSAGRNSSRVNDANESCFDRNYHRYRTHGLGTAELIHENSVWPRITPTSFVRCIDGNDVIGTERSHVPFVFNVGPCAGIEMLNDTPTGDNETACQGVTGKFSYLLDLAATRLTDPEHGHVSACGVTEDALKDFIDHANGIVFDEDPSNVRLFTQPLIDCTDPFQCGFDIMLSDKIQTPNEVKVYEMPESYGGDTSVEVSTYELDDETYTIEPGMPDDTSTTGFSLIHVINDQYRNLMRYMFIFVGDGIFDHPYQNLSSIVSALPVYEMVYGSYSSDMCERLAAKWTEPAGAVNPANGYQSISLSILGAGFVGLANGTIAESSAAIMDVIRTKYNKTTNPMDMILATFNPQYGPIKIVVATATEIAGKMPTSIWSEQPMLPTQGNLTPSLVLSSHLDNLMAGFNNLKRVISWDSVKYAVRYWLEFLTEFTFNPSSYDTGYKTYITPKVDGFEPIIVTDQGHNYRTFLATVVAQFCGCDKFSPFWDSKCLSESALKSLPPSIKTTIAMPENDVMAEPRVPRSSKSPDRNYSDIKAKTTGWSTPTKESLDSLDNNRPFKAGKKSDSKPNRKHKSGKSKFRNSMNADGISKDSDIGIKEGSTFDDSTLKEEKLSDKLVQKGKKDTTANLML